MIRLKAEKALCKDNIIYMLAKEAGLFFSFDMCKGEIKLICTLEDDYFFEDRLFGDIKKYKSKFLLIPANAKNIYVVDCCGKMVDKIPISEKYGNEKYMTSEIIDDDLYLFGHGIHKSNKINLKSKEIIELKQLDNELFFSSVTKNGKIYLPSCKKSCLYIFDNDSGRTEQKQIGCFPFNGILIEENNISFAPRNSDKLYTYNINREKVEEISIPYCNAVGIFKIGNDIYLPSTNEGQSIIVGSMGKITPWNLKKRFLFAKDEGAFVVLLTDEAELILINKSTKKEEKKILEISYEELDKFLNERKIRRNNDTKESNINSLRSFLDSIK